MRKETKIRKELWEKFGDTGAKWLAVVKDDRGQVDWELHKDKPKFITRAYKEGIYTQAETFRGWVEADPSLELRAGHCYEIKGDRIRKPKMEWVEISTCNNYGKGFVWAKAKRYDLEMQDQAGDVYRKLGGLWLWENAEGGWWATAMKFLDKEYALNAAGETEGEVLDSALSKVLNIWSQDVRETLSGVERCFGGVPEMMYEFRIGMMKSKGSRLRKLRLGVKGTKNASN